MISSLFGRRILVLVIGALLALMAAMPIASGQSPGTNQSTAVGDTSTKQDKNIKVMTRNLYLGADLGPVDKAVQDLRSGTGTPANLQTAVDNTWNNVKATNFPERADALADEIEQYKPLVVGLQEVELYRTQTPSDYFTNPTPNATTVALDDNDVPLDFLAILQKN